MAKNFLLFLISLVFCITVQAQEAKKIRIINADIAIDETEKQYTRILNNVVFQHDSAILYCDSAYFKNRQNSLEAFGQVHLKINDTTHLFCKRLVYNGDTRVAHAETEVVLKDNTMTLFTDFLDYYRNNNYAYYPQKGRIIDESKQLFSDIGYYYSDINEFHFQKNVLLMDSAYHLLSDTLLYNTESNLATILGPTEIIGEERYSYCEKGWYNTETDDARLFINVCATESSQIAYCDSIFYDSQSSTSHAFGRISATDTVEKITVMGLYAEYHRKEGFGFVVDSAVAIMVDDNDSLFLHADTLFIRIDSSEKIQFISAFHHMKFYRQDLQGACDSLIYIAADSSIRMYREPILWSEKNQMTSDSIYIFVSNNNIDSMIFYHNAFIIANDTLDNYNQVKGKTVDVLFKNNEIQKISAFGNAESVYYIRDEEKSLIGIDKASSSMLYILMKENEFESVTYIKDSKATTYPKKEFPIEFKKMRGFRLQEHRRPANRYEIFLKDSN